MHLKIFLKEWRENILVFSLSIVLLFALVVLNFAGEAELTMYFSGMFLWIFLPFAALLIGSSGFYSEFKDNAWIYLFSRPVKKWQIWLTKYVALLSIFVLVVIIFYLILQFLPGLRDILDDSGLLFMMGGLVAYSPFLMVSFLALTVSYAISILSEKQFVLVFASILIGTGFLFLAWKYQEFLVMTYFYFRRVEGLILLAGLSFMAASILTFVKVDFSQKGKKIIHFSKYLVIFIIVSFLIHLVWVTGGRLSTSRTVFHAFHSHKIDGNVYVNSYRHGILKYEEKHDKFVRLNRKSGFSDWIFSVAGEKVAFLKDVRRGRQNYTNLWIMNTDGSELKDLTESHKRDSPFHDDSIQSCLLSPDGRRIAIISDSRTRGGKMSSLWLMGSDGSRLEKIDLSMPGHQKFRTVAWSGAKKTIFLTAEEESRKVVQNVKLMLFFPEAGQFKVLVENVISFPDLYVSPKNRHLVIRYRTGPEIEKRMGHMAILDMESLEIEEFLAEENLRVGRISWNSEGDRIAFSKHNVVEKSVDYKLMVYSVSDNKIAKTDYGAYMYGLGYDWLLNDNKLVVSDVIDQEPCLRVLDENLVEERQLPFAKDIENNWTIWGLDKSVLVQKSRRGGFWRLNLETEEWKKVF